MPSRSSKVGSRDQTAVTVPAGRSWPSSVAGVAAGSTTRRTTLRLADTVGRPGRGRELYAQPAAALCTHAPSPQALRRCVRVLLPITRQEGATHEADSDPQIPSHNARASSRQPRPAMTTPSLLIHALPARLSSRPRAARQLLLAVAHSEHRRACGRRTPWEPNLTAAPYRITRQTRVRSQT